ncbi:Alpha/Beta hydrolase protein [Amylocarpus encephaloides]|uniref:Alpha/Beta hydrolase protein n=1 Tax=Amylocarpus encephaloides TaxID=45428 RepID=A0A9P7YDR2_9HELO|nr:Alpha/Beta hydrolase protein [Amylocarpus encephaloides]
MDSSHRPAPAFQLDTFVVQPTSAHTHTIILLHGLGSNGEKFGTELLQSGVSYAGRKLTEIYPAAKFVFPTAKKRRSSAFRRARLNQWFDIASLGDPSHRREVQLQGLAESVLEIRGILNQELVTIPKSNIILGGLSQGCAMSLSILLTLEFPLGGFVGMSGWLPFRGDIDDIINSDKTPDDEENEVTFSFGGSEEEEVLDPFVATINFARDLLSMDALDISVSKSTQTSLTTPVFLAHGEDDEKVKVTLGQEAAQTLSSLGIQTTWKSYPGLGHWYKIPEEIDDIVGFLHTSLVKDASNGIEIA